MIWTQPCLLLIVPPHLKLCTGLQQFGLSVELYPCPQDQLCYEKTCLSLLTPTTRRIGEHTREGYNKSENRACPGQMWNGM